MSSLHLAAVAAGSVVFPRCLFNPHPHLPPAIRRFRGWVSFYCNTTRALDNLPTAPYLWVGSLQTGGSA